jgi:2-polyprenyl-3-methyl-5-hydroxy-6-metoxy-1,4-benzoquinol methylase
MQLPVFARGEYEYVRCCKCGTLSTNPIPDAKAIAAHYAARQKNYDVLLSHRAEVSRGVYCRFVDLLRSVLMEQNRTLDGMSVLDVGCFTGDFLGLMSERNASVWGVELQADACAIASKRFPGRIVNGDIAQANFVEHSFDIVSLLGVIEHVADPLALLKQAGRLLREGGILLIQTPNSGSILSRCMRGYWPPCAPVEHIHLMSTTGLSRALWRLGFTEIRTNAHIKHLPISYVYDQLGSFGSELRRLFSPIYALLPKSARGMVLPFYGGEMTVVAKLGAWINDNERKP